MSDATPSDHSELTRFALREARRTLKDHEDRIRILERGQWKLAGAAMMGSILGSAILQLLLAR